MTVRPRAGVFAPLRARVFAAPHHVALNANTLRSRSGVPPVCADCLERRRSAGALFHSWHHADRRNFERPLRHDNAMGNSPTPSTRSLAFTVPTHLAEALRETVDDFLAKAAGGTTPAQRAAEIRAQDRDASLDSLAHLLEVAEGSSGQARIVAQFLAGIYNGDDYPFSLTDFRRLERFAGALPAGVTAGQSASDGSAPLLSQWGNPLAGDDQTMGAG